MGLELFKPLRITEDNNIRPAPCCLPYRESENRIDRCRVTAKDYNGLRVFETVNQVSSYALAKQVLKIFLRCGKTGPRYRIDIVRAADESEYIFLKKQKIKWSQLKLLLPLLCDRENGGPPVGAASGREKVIAAEAAPTVVV